MKTVLRIFTAFVLVVLTYTAAYAQQTDTIKNGLKLYYERNFQAASEQFDTAMRSNPADSLVVVYLVDCYRQENKLQQLLNAWEEEALESPKNPHIKCRLGFAYFAQSLSKRDELFEESTNQFQEALKLNGDLAMGYLGVGTVYYQKRMMSRARSYFSKAVKLNNKESMAIERLGDIYLVDDKNYGAAKNLFQDLIELYPDYPDGYFFAGAACQALGDYDEAIEYFLKAMALDPLGLTQGYYAPVRIGDIYFNHLKNNEKALEYYEKALKINAENSYARTMVEKAKGTDGKDEKKKK